MDVVRASRAGAVPRDAGVNRPTVLEELRDGVVVLTMNRPAQRNAFNDQQYGDLRAALADAQADERVSVAVITGAAGAFTAGQDINEMGAGAGSLPSSTSCRRSTSHCWRR